MSTCSESSDESARRAGDEDGSSLGGWWEAQVGRRPVLQAGLGSAVGLGLGSRALLGAGDAAAKPASQARKAPPPMEFVDLQFAYGHVHGISSLALIVNGERFQLRRHTKASRAALRKRGGLFAEMDLAVLSHYATGVQVPAHQTSLVSVQGRHGRREVLVGQMWHVPKAAVRAEARKLLRRKGAVLGSPHRLKALGLHPSQVRSQLAAVQLASIGDSTATAMTLVMSHPNVATKNPTNAATTQTLLQTGPAEPAVVKDLGGYILKMQLGGHGYAKTVPATDENGNPASIKIPIVQDGVVTGYQSTGFKTLQLNTNDTEFPLFQSILKAALVEGITQVRNTASLGAVIDTPVDQAPAASTQTWVQPQGIVPQPQTLAAARRKRGAGLSIQVKNPGCLFGTTTQVNGAYNNGQVPLKLYNNFVRWVWVYVQYLGASDTNLSLNPGASFPDTKYSQSLGLLPQVFTILGVPIWDTNTIDVTLNFPQGAHTARILYCGLGSNLLDGSWRNYFPTGAYPDMIAPSEVNVAAVLTGILSIGMTVFALATDIDIATTWAAINKIIEDEALFNIDAFEELTSFVSSNVALSATETVAATVATGGATYEYIKANGGDTTNLWSLMLALASVIPKLLFASTVQLWARVAVAVLGEETADKILEAIPYLGQVIAVIEAVGDAVTLAETCAETIVSPWVIENEVNLTYPATVTISRDTADGAATFPVEAVSWSLEAKIDGAVVLDPTTGTINEGGHIQSDPLVVPVTAPFGGNTIQWSVTFLDASGAQVGTGVSDPLPNDDPTNPPSTVSFSIKNIQISIGASTVFKRADATGYDPTAGGYTWSNQITDAGTVLSGGIQQVTGTTISTLAGVAGVVWEQGNQFYVRGVPVAQNGATIDLGVASTEGYARRPFLLFDAFVDRAATGNHVLLEPDPVTTAYHVRKVTLDPTTGAPSWDSTVSYGTFLVPVSAAALHSSGRVIAISTNTARLGQLLPAATNAPQPVQASYTAGSGTQIGLVGSPIAVAVTNPGTVLILDAANAQIAAFDLNGNPVPYFSETLTRRSLFTRSRLGASAGGQYTLPLATTGTYLDLAVDGAGQIYTLYYTGDGSTPAQYHVDVYAQTGAVLDTASPGVNVPHIAVDYWRSIYGANYDALENTATGKAQIDPRLGVIEPSLSRFDPTNPTTRKRGTNHDTAAGRPRHPDTYKPGRKK